MRNKVAKIIAIVIVFIFGGAYIYNKLTKPSLCPKTAKLYQHGFSNFLTFWKPIWIFIYNYIYWHFLV
ncbi:metal-dependent CAAX amino terminal membrane protease [Streptococcus australis]|uniref:Metal-dependent CAAX amino terminal membrane protease n=1 Tax=Streptococcus australis TaxID=113107 RepID=A0A4V0BXF7_9STRE|nr:metal-dependent CAAX amino terminal membrane protease [Streptococcus australis]